MMLDYSAVVTAAGTAITAVAAVYAAWVGIKTYRDSVTVRLAQTLLQAETIFKDSLPIYALIEDDRRYEQEIAPVLAKATNGTKLTDDDINRLLSVDRAVRFFYIFLVHKRFQGDSDAILTAYLYYWALLSNQTKRRELADYIDKFYPGTAWRPRANAHSN